jgi:flagellar biosynthesis/type III secretory pathway protein FliH
MAVLWLRFLKEVGEDAAPSDLQENAEIRRALDICEEGGFTAAELAAYEKYWDFIHTERALLAESQAEGIAKGIAKGMARGIAKGRAEGEAKGQAESLRRVVLNCRRSGLSVEQIQEVTGLGREKILAIFDQLKK